MGTLMTVFLTLVIAITTLLVGVMRKNKLLKITSLVLFVISAVLFLLVMYSLGTGS